MINNAITNFEPETGITLHSLLLSHHDVNLVHTAAKPTDDIGGIILGHMVQVALEHQSAYTVSIAEHQTASSDSHYLQIEQFHNQNMYTGSSVLLTDCSVITEGLVYIIVTTSIVLLLP